jgi:hypothetical protein
MHTAAAHRRKSPASLFTTHLLVIPGHGRIPVKAPPRQPRVTPAQWLEAKRQT